MADPHELVMQLTVAQTKEGLVIDTQFAEGYGEPELRMAIEMWLDELDGEDRSPGWGRP